MKGARRAALVVAAAIATGATWVAAETYVIPVVVSGVPGVAGSFWDSEVRITKLFYQGAVHVRRAWVALRDGSVVDDPASAPSWVLAEDGMRMLVVTGSDLLARTGATQGAVALDVEGEADVFLHVAETRRAPRLVDGDGTACCLPGSGQAMRVLPEPLVGPSHASWATAGTGTFRINVGLVNPNSAPIEVRVRLYPFLSGNGIPPFVWYSPWAGIPWTSVTLPGMRWIQVNSPYETVMCAGTLEPHCPTPGHPFERPVGPAVIEFVPSSSDPYYAYVSLVYSPTNDPEFVQVLPGGLEVPTD